MNAGEKKRVGESLELMVRCEEAIMGFYLACAGAWPREQGFWGDLAADECVRMTRLQLMQHRTKDSENAAKSIHVFPAAVLIAFLGWVEGNTARVIAGDVDRRGALAIARDIERTPVVNDQFHVSRLADPDLANYLLSFATDYGEHTRRIEERLGRSVTTARVA